MLEKINFMYKKLKISFSKDLIILGIGMLAIIGLGVFIALQKMIMVGIMVASYSLIYLIMHFLSIKSKYKQLVNAKEIAFNAFYRYVITLLKNNNILFSALQTSLEYIDEVLIDDVNELILDIENDTSLEPFLNFMNNFEDESIKQMIIMLYKIQEIGVVDEVLDSINDSIIKIQDTSISNYIIREEKRIEKYYFIPIILSALIMLLISFYVFTLLGDGLYV
ncbi:MAG: hypothetical protein SOU19_08410 [Candidatus Caccosoma sp.]|nr:hypothetical protein [Candidatus Caccosoma sp.]